ncbi:MAG: ATP-binding protein [Bacteroidales bacterium]|nr:ATP-binding protein [Bacteroidales bacterium]
MNPFTVTYRKGYFCDRNIEVEQLKANVDNGLNTLVHSPRRMGKTALILHLFDELKNTKEYDCLFIDLFSTQNMEGLIRILAEKVLETYHSRNFLKGISSILKGLSPSLSVSADGTPSLSLNIEENQYETTLDHIFKYLEKRKKKVIVAFDEFQEVAEYPEKAEAILRTYIQQLRNVQFIFSGSSNHLLQEMFSSAQRPFYQSSEVLVLDKLKRVAYAEFITHMFIQNKKNVDDDALEYILDFTDSYTYYTQVICNQLFYKTKSKLSKAEAIVNTNLYIESRKADYQSLLNLLPDNQKRLAIAIANEEIVSSPTALEFLTKYKLPSASSSLLAINTLNKKEIVYKKSDGFVIYDVFFKRFLQRYYPLR